jgi:glucose-6-phosphate isomerase
MEFRNPHFQALDPGALSETLSSGLNRLANDRVIPRIWARDPSVWRDRDVEISNRLGWLAAPEAAAPIIQDLQAFAACLKEEGFRRILLMGMGGSSLAAEVFGRVFPTRDGFMDLDILDSTAPETVLGTAAVLDIEKTLFIVSSKSGTTAELAALFCYFYDLARKKQGENGAGLRFVAITDAGTALESLAAKCRFRRVFHGQADVGGRFSALTAFGLVPAALKGVDLGRFLRGASDMQSVCRNADPFRNPAALLGALLGVAATAGRDKLTLFVSPDVGPLAGWLEQLIAESTGKDGKGIVPVIEEAPPANVRPADDRIFVEIRTAGETQPPSRDPGRHPSPIPFLRIVMADPYSLGGQFFLWEMATAVAGYFLKINPFDQPNVEATKKKTREILEGTASKDLTGPAKPVLTADGLRVYAEGKPGSPREAVNHFLENSREGDYIAIQVFLAPTAEVRDLLEELSRRLYGKSRRPVTIGYGPRYLHSTGQLHKGDGNRGLFIQLARPASADVPIPEIPEIQRPAPSFGALFSAQGWGDWLALRDLGRRTLRLEFEGSAEQGLRRLIALFE